MKFACLVYVDNSKLALLTPEEGAKLTDQSLEFDAGLEVRGLMNLAYPLQNPSTALTIRLRDGRVSGTDGPFAETKEQLAGFFLLDVDSREEAARLASESPLISFGSIEIRPFLERERS